jgi:hypothetical protein
MILVSLSLLVREKIVVLRSKDPNVQAFPFVRRVEFEPSIVTFKFSIKEKKRELAKNAMVYMGGDGNERTISPSTVP